MAEPTAEPTVLRKDQLEISLHNEKKLIKEGTIKDDNPLDLSEPFRELCNACRKGDLKVCQEKITEGVNINARDPYDYTPLILVSDSKSPGNSPSNAPAEPLVLGHCFSNRAHYASETRFKAKGYFVPSLIIHGFKLHVQLTLGHLRRCLYNALNDRIRNLLLEYDYSKSTDPLQPLAAHITSLLTRDSPETSDIVVTAGEEDVYLHKFILAARSPYFRKKLESAPETVTWKLPSAVPPQSFGAAIRYLYFGEAPRDLKTGPGTGFTESEVFVGIDKIAKYLEINALLDSILDSGDRRLARQRRTLELAKGRDQLEEWFRTNVLRNKMEVETSKVDEIKWNHDNAIFADVLLQADELPEDEDLDDTLQTDEGTDSSTIPVGPVDSSSTSKKSAPKSVIFPCHRAMLLRSEFFLTMFSSSFREAHLKEHLNVISVDCSPEVLEIILTFLYTERADFPLDIAVDVLFAADMLFIEKLKTKAAVVIGTLGNGDMSQAEAAKTRGTQEEDDLDIYAIIRAAWLTRVQRLEEFAARYLAYRLEAHIDSPEFSDLIQESAARIQGRQETDSIELLDDIRFYLGERFRLRFDDAGLEEMMEEETRQQQEKEDHDDHVDKAVNAIENGTAELELENKHNAQSAETTPEQLDQDKSDHAPVIKTLDGQVVDDEFSKDAMDYEILLDKLDKILEDLDLDA
ncbi:ankyrin repeat and BTB/POZ domain protein [Aspergillus affinis]|uniref:ankyrin repeat and BTB/POZ domain protein n=1 Tax=Aspergillus affinis TaxID=1070780 RepID=UPI0022FF0402|nr:ankyrin repeat and BTB/POZ domain protein [Aspergillus affinis]KAI9044955.1 ankyrin repeat and BTB/POZ domain protein [Aspergillus affinis]